jgi:hypothetical protein
MMSRSTGFWVVVRPEVEVVRLGIPGPLGNGGALSQVRLGCSVQL